MYKIWVDTVGGKVQETIYEIGELYYLDKMLSCKDSKKRGIHYLDIPISFDIETTNIYKKGEDGKPLPDPRPFAYMYHWQFCFDDQVVFGRTWEEFQKLLKMLERNLNLSYKNRIVVWVHNLPFEWQFMRDFIDYEEGFFREERAPLKVVTKGGIEFRCSYALSNMSLQKFCENEKNVFHYKLDGDKYDYEKIRTPATKMEEYELAYCYNDVRGLCECIASRLQEDTLASIPLTSTGYVRRELRNNVVKNKKNRERFVNNKLDEKLYTYCRDAFRGGDTHANSDYADQILHNVWSYDIKSSYPASIMEYDGYPQSAFSKMKVSTYINRDVSEYACLLQVRFINIRYDYKAPTACGIPYIALAKCSRFSRDKIIDNGRVVFASMLEMVITDIDFYIIRKEYKYDDLYLNDIYAARKGKLSEEIRNTTMDYFRKKCLLDGDETKKYEYTKSKNRLNSIYGCMVMRIDQQVIKWDPIAKKYVPEEEPIQVMLDKFYKSRNNFLQYQHGIYITAASRLRLREMLWTVGRDVIYCDTDSIKGLGDHQKDFDTKNNELKQLAIDCGAYAENALGEVFYLGIWENETEKHLYDEFRTLGAKKYVYKIGDKVKSTIAGVNKKSGAEYFTKHGLEGFKVGAVITNSGHLTAFYNDEENIKTITIKGCTFTTGSNVALVNNQYKIGVTDDYAEILLKGLANMYDIE